MLGSKRLPELAQIGRSARGDEGRDRGSSIIGRATRGAGATAQGPQGVKLATDWLRSLAGTDAVAASIGFVVRRKD